MKGLICQERVLRRTLCALFILPHTIFHYPISVMKPEHFAEYGLLIATTTHDINQPQLVSTLAK